MRMRKKPNLIPRLERCAPVIIQEPESYRGRWKELFPQAKKVCVEVGCGKGKFTAETAAAEPDMLLIAIERVPEALVMATEKAMDAGLKNVFYISADVEKLEEYFAPGEIDLIFINFCDPWPSKKHAKRRLTAPGFLEKYKKVLAPAGAVFFKTDNAPLFEYSLEQFEANGFRLEAVTRNLHENGPVGIMTGYEEKFYNLGTPINRCEAYLQG